MVFSYSPQHEGGILHLPSPTHCHRFDATSTLMQLRRSLSRSPSKSPAFRLVTAKVTSPTGRSPLSPSALSPHRHTGRLDLLSGHVSPQDVLSPRSPHSRQPSSPNPPSPLGKDMPPQRTTRGQVRKFSPKRANSGARPYSLTRPGGPRRALLESMDSGNATPNKTPGHSKGPENSPSTSPQQASVLQVPKVEFTGFGTGVREGVDLRSSIPETTAPQNFNFLSDKHPINFGDAPVKSSPLKRVDAPSKTDPSEGSSPSAKRRSLHGAVDFDIFDQFASSQNNASGQNSPEFAPAADADGLHTAAASSPILKRSNSLRKSTLQQRHQERPGLIRAKGSHNLTHDYSNAMSPATAQRKFLESSRLPTRRNLFSAGNEPAVETACNEPVAEPPRAPARHPLSRTITQSSSGSELAQDSPTHIPVRAPKKQQSYSAFARSLPIGLGRTQTLARQASAGSSDGSDVATPDAPKISKATQPTFMSTGLISKRTKHLQDQALGEVKVMPDTPCKRPMPMNPMAPGGTPAPAPRHTQLRRSQHSFGSPSPFNTRAAGPAANSAGKGVGIFGSSIKPLNRRGSFLSIESDEAPASSAYQSFENPPTPSKGNDLNSSSIFTPRHSIFAPDLHKMEEPADGFAPALASPAPDLHCKFTLNGTDGLPLDADGDSEMSQESPTAHRRFHSLGVGSYSGHRRPSILVDDHSPSPTPQARKSHTLPHIRTSNLNLNAKSPAPPVSPLLDRHEHRSPQTPRYNRSSVAPPDPSGLSISGQANQTVDFLKSTFGNSHSLGSAAFLPPATPTANRDASRFHSSRAAQSTSQAIAEVQADSSLTGRFDTIEMIGEGEFSSVLKVSRMVEGLNSSNDSTHFGSFSSNISASPAKTAKRCVWAVKKARYPYKGKLDRQNKLKEVEVLKALGGSEHTIRLEDHWEHDLYLYIQTEYCDEGSLSSFLNDAGRAARLDDFRIWKILLETALGVKFIHDSGFIHLDLKPANILITFDGTLKIGDFGMATSWPARKGVDGEGDREYIGPEILMGKIDKPADIYSLGLIMLEIAANVVLPDNGASWQRLRSGDMSDVPSLTSTEDFGIERDASGRVIEDEDRSTAEKFNPPVPVLSAPPEFMADRNHAHSLDSLVSWMITPDPTCRPVVDQVIAASGVQWVSDRRRAGATIYEGTWGPADEVLVQDAEMMDV